MRILGFDPSLRDTGWVLLEMEPNGSCRMVKSGRIKTDSDEVDTVSYLEIRKDMGGLIGGGRFDVAACEQPPPGESYSAGLYPIFMFFKAWCLKHRRDNFHFTPSVLKADVRHLLDREGGMRKPDMVDGAEELLEDGDRVNHNIADAVHVAWKAGRLNQLVRGVIDRSDLSERQEYSMLKIVNHRDGTRTFKGDVYKEGDDRHSTYTMLSLPKYDYLY